ncbi:MAG: SCO family protein [Magnetococcales bacterium]|nr:SCO family protein [Magnetococcales bacterium]
MHKKLSKKQLLTVSLIILFGVFSCFKLWQHYFQAKIPSYDLRGITLPHPVPLQPFSLVDHHGKPFNLDNLYGRWSFIFLGYSNCPDVCPISLNLLANTFAELKEREELLAKTQTVVISVDPKRDKQESLKDYVSYFHPQFIGATGEPEDILSLAKQLKASYKISPTVDEEGNYLVEHTSAFFLIDPKGRFFALFQPQFHDAIKIKEAFIAIYNARADTSL